MNKNAVLKNLQGLQRNIRSVQEYYRYLIISMTFQNINKPLQLKYIKMFVFNNIATSGISHIIKAIIPITYLILLI